MDRKKSTAKIPISKIFHDKLATSEQIASWYSGIQPTCLRCRATGETQHHLYQCRSQHARLAFDKALREVKGELRKIHTAPIVITQLAGLLEEYRKGHKPPMQSYPFQSEQIRRLARKVYDKQKQIGLHLLPKGMLILEWEALQNSCSNASSTEESNVEWASQVIQIMWNFSQTMWDTRCEKINAPTNGSGPSLKITELRKVLKQELTTLDHARNYDTIQLISNIKTKIDTAHETTMYKWLNTIRQRKEEEAGQLSHGRAFTSRARTLNQFFQRPEGT